MDRTIQTAWIVRRIEIEPLDPWTRVRCARKLPCVPRGCRLKPIRIVLGCGSRLLRDIVMAAIGNEPDLHVVGELGDRTQADELLQHSGPGVLLVSDDGRSAELHWLERRTARCADVSPEGLVALIRHAFAGEDGR
jgi:hypothetical protein